MTARVFRIVPYQDYLADGCTGAGLVTGAAFGQQEAAQNAATTASRANFTYFMVVWLFWFFPTPHHGAPVQASLPAPHRKKDLQNS